MWGGLHTPVSRLIVVVLTPASTIRALFVLSMFGNVYGIVAECTKQRALFAFSGTRRFGSSATL
jgi:hypothetical protein